MDLGEVFASSWKVFWKRKTLWLFSIVPLLIYVIPAIVAVLVFFNPKFFSGNIDPFLSYGILIFELVYLILVIVYVFIYVLADASLIKGTLLFDQKGEKPTISELIKQSLPFYWRVFGLYAIFIGLYLILMTAIFAFVIVAGILTLGIGLLCFVPLLLLIVPAVWLGTAFLELARTSILYDQVGIGECLKRGWALFKGKFWQIVLVALILYLGLTIISTVFYLPLYAISFIPMFRNLSQGAVAVQNIESQIFSSMRWTYIIFIPFFSLVSGILSTFIHEAWAITYVRLSRPPAAENVPAASPSQMNGNAI